MSRRNKSVLLVLILAVSAFFFVFRKNERQTARARNLTYQTFSTGSGWGYRIFTDDTLLLIQQDVIPGMPGNNGFDSEAKAAATANLVLSKIRSGLFPPAVSPAELDSLGVL